MARLTLSEQVAAQASQISTLTADLQAARETIASHLRANELMQAEVERQRRLLEDLPTLREQVTKLAKELEITKNSLTYRSTEADKINSELEQAHAVLDGVEGAPPREYEMEYGKGRRNVVTRLAGAILAIVKNGGVK